MGSGSLLVLPVPRVESEVLVLISHTGKVLVKIRLDLISDATSFSGALGY